MSDAAIASEDLLTNARRYAAIDRSGCGGGEQCPYAGVSPRAVSATVLRIAGCGDRRAGDPVRHRRVADPRVYAERRHHRGGADRGARGSSGVRPAADRPIACGTGQRIHARHDVGRDPAFRSAASLSQEVDHRISSGRCHIPGRRVWHWASIEPGVPQPAVSAADRDYFQALQGGNCQRQPSGRCRRAEPAVRSTSTSRYAVQAQRIPSMASFWRAHARVSSRSSGRHWCQARVRCSACIVMTAEYLPVCRQPTWPVRPSIRTDR